MTHDIALETPHGLVDACLARPDDAPRGGLVILQEIFGLNAHVRNLVKRMAAQGYIALAPALFDPVQRGVELGYTPADARRGLELRDALGFDRACDIVRVAARKLHDEGLKVGVVGYCWGGTVAFLSNTRLGLPAVSYYGTRTVGFLDESLRAPMLFHFGALDQGIPQADIAAHRRKQPHAEAYVYPDAGHAFNRDVDNTHYNPAAAGLALGRTLDFLTRALT